MKTILVLILLGLAIPAQAQITFTGDALADFVGSGALQINDPGGQDVGVPLVAPAGTISGWDIRTVYLNYDQGADRMYVGFDFYGIGGDADGNGDPGSTSAWLAASGGQDLPDLGGTESISFMIDTDQDGTVEVVVGVAADQDFSMFGAYLFTGTIFAPGFGYGAALPNTAAVFASPSASQPDFEFYIDAFSTLPNMNASTCDAVSFNIGANAGSFSDAGIGEDFNPAAGALTAVSLPPCPVPGAKTTFGAVKSRFR